LTLADLVKLNEPERETLSAVLPSARGQICVTLAERGCEIDGAHVPGYRTEVTDAVGAGDAFAAALLHGLADGRSAAEAADFANRVGALVASRHGGTPFWTIEEAAALTR
jgi:sugar/nucleoside kinase (ribokinase family)